MKVEMSSLASKKDIEHLDYVIESLAENREQTQGVFFQKGSEPPIFVIVPAILPFLAAVRDQLKDEAASAGK